MRVALALAIALASSGCASTDYRPQLVAQGELTLRYDQGFEMWANGRRVSSGVTWHGLRRYVRCVPPAVEQAEKAQSAGAATLAMATLATTFGLGGLGVGAIGATVDPNNGLTYLLSGAGAAIVGLVFGILTQMERNAANGHAVDAMNYYNDAQGSWGGSCAQPIGPVTGPVGGQLEQLPPPPPPPPPSPDEED